MLTTMTELRVLTINIWNEQGPWDERKRLLREGIEALSPDIIGMQEVISRGEPASQAHALVAGLGHDVAFGAARPLDDTSHYGNAITSRFPITSERVVEIPCLGVDEPRSALIVEVALPEGTLPIICTHFSWRLDHQHVRTAQAVAIAEVLDELPGDRLPPLFMGDLNAAPDEPAIQFLVGNHPEDGRSVQLTDCFAAAGEGDGFTFDGRHNLFARPWNEPPRRIDYIMVDGPDRAGRGTPVDAQVVLDMSIGDIAPSDHYGVLARVSYR